MDDYVALASLFSSPRGERLIGFARGGYGNRLSVSRSLERATLNELRFRAANETIEERRVELGVDGRVPYLCECEDESCRELVRLAADEYQEARASQRHFVLARGHPFRSGTIVGDHDGYVVVEKGGEAADVIEHGEGSSGG